MKIQELNISLNAKWTQDISIDILSASGQSVLHQKVLSNKGFSEKLLNLSELKAGIYLLRITAEDEVNYIRIIKSQ